MAIDALNRGYATTKPERSNLSQIVESFDWLRHYRREDLAGDFLAGLIVTIMLVPQGMAYALLAGLPPQVGLYASIVPLILYGLLGSSRTLAVGPVALVSLLVVAGVGPLAEQGSGSYLQLALTLALIVGGIQLLMGVARLGFLVNFLSQPVLAGFSSAAAIVIGFSQIKHILGLTIPNSEYFYQALFYVAGHLSQVQLVTLAIGLGSIAVLLVFKIWLGNWLRPLGLEARLVTSITKSGPLVIVIVGTFLVWGLNLSESGVSVVGTVPAGLPPLTNPLFDLTVWQSLLPTALTISFIGYVQSISVAKSLASKRRQKIRANQELMALGVANVGAAFSGGYPVTGGFSRSVVNFSAGANTGLASIITALLVAVTVVLFTPLFYFLPKAVLGAIILVAVIALIDMTTFKHVWRYNKADAASMIITFMAVLVWGIEPGILVGVVAALTLYIWRTSRPHIAVVGRIDNSETYRNVLRHQVVTCAHTVAIRVDESLYFVNTKYLESTILQIVADYPNVKYLLLIGIAINFIDASALETLEGLIDELQDAGVELHLAEIKGPVMDRLQSIGFVERLGAGRIHLSTHDAMRHLGCVSTISNEQGAMNK